jgi:hypothetical protein
MSLSKTVASAPDSGMLHLMNMLKGNRPGIWFVNWPRFLVLVFTERREISLAAANLSLARNVLPLNFPDNSVRIYRGTTKYVPCVLK